MSSPINKTSPATPASSVKTTSTPTSTASTLEAIKAEHRAKLLADGIVPAALPSPKRKTKKSRKPAKTRSKPTKDVVPGAEAAKPTNPLNGTPISASPPPSTTKAKATQPQITTKATGKPNYAPKTQNPISPGATPTPEPPTTQPPNQKRKHLSPNPATPSPRAAKKPKPNTPLPHTTTGASKTPEPTPTPPALAAKSHHLASHLTTATITSSSLAPGIPPTGRLALTPRDLLGLLRALESDYGERLSTTATTTGTGTSARDSRAQAKATDTQLFDQVREMFVAGDEGAEVVVLDLRRGCVWLEGLLVVVVENGGETVGGFGGGEGGRVLGLEAVGRARGGRFLGLGEQGGLVDLGFVGGRVVEGVGVQEGDFFAEAWGRVLGRERERVVAGVVGEVVEMAVLAVETERLEGGKVGEVVVGGGREVVV
ncbi:hypothetical protein MBLNU230_g8595t1 [Neophaeotheca triangularis]